MISRGRSNGLAPASLPGARSDDWTFEVGLAAPGKYKAFIVELKSVKSVAGEGSTRAEALENLERVFRDYLEAEAQRGEEVRPIDPPNRLTIRIPRSVRERMARSAEVQGVTLNHLISSVLAEYIGRSGDHLPGDFPPAGEELRDVIWSSKDPAQATRAAKSVEAAKEVMRGVEARRGTNLGLLVRALLADRIAEVEGRHEASRHLGKSARIAADAEHHALAEAFWNESLALESGNRVSHGALGAFLLTQGRYADAIDHLEEAPDSLIWAPVELELARLHVALDQGSRKETAEAAEAVIAALEKSAHDRRALAHRQAWLRYLRMLQATDAVATDAIENLVAYANAKADWSTIDASEVFDGAHSKGKRSPRPA